MVQRCLEKAGKLTIACCWVDAWEAGHVRSPRPCDPRPARLVTHAENEACGIQGAPTCPPAQRRRAPTQSVASRRAAVDTTPASVSGGGGGTSGWVSSTAPAPADAAVGASCMRRWCCCVSFQRADGGCKCRCLELHWNTRVPENDDVRLHKEVHMWKDGTYPHENTCAGSVASQAHWRGGQ